MSREATEVSMIWSQRGDKGEEPSPGRRMMLGAGVRPYPGVRQEGKAGRAGKGWESSEAATVCGKSCWGKEGLEAGTLRSYTQGKSWEMKAAANKYSWLKDPHREEGTSGCHEA